MHGPYFMSQIISFSSDRQFELDLESLASNSVYTNRMRFIRDAGVFYSEIQQRGELMNNAVAPNETGMAALIGKNSNQVQKIISENNLNLEIANDNSEIQIVISGKMEDLNNSKDLFLDNSIKKFVLLNVRKN